MSSVVLVSCNFSVFTSRLLDFDKDKMNYLQALTSFMRYLWMAIKISCRRSRVMTFLIHRGAAPSCLTSWLSLLLVITIFALQKNPSPVIPTWLSLVTMSSVLSFVLFNRGQKKKKTMWVWFIDFVSCTDSCKCLNKWYKTGDLSMLEGSSPERKRPRPPPRCNKVFRGENQGWMEPRW